MALETQPELGEMDAFYQDLAGKKMDALWRRDFGSAARGSLAAYPPAHWRWSDIRPQMDRAGQLVRPGPDASRRVIQLINPALGAARSASHTLTANVQMILPGEIAPSHRHLAGAIRFIIEGTAAVSIVNGEPVSMSPGDLVLTPSMHWHGHISDADGPMLWMDSLDRALLVALKQGGGGEAYDDELQPAAQPLGTSFAKFGGGYLRPLGAPAATPNSPLFVYPWAQTERALQELAQFEADPFDDVAFDYTNPQTGQHVMPTIGCRIQMLRPGVHTRAHRHSYVSVYHLFRGRGSTIVEGIQIDWEQGDFLVVPPGSWHEHINRSATDPAYLFSTIDAPVIEALDIAREDKYAENGGHQTVTGQYTDY